MSLMFNALVSTDTQIAIVERISFHKVWNSLMKEDESIWEVE